ncbi:MAG: hypothetical protein J2P23_07535 [Microlunatus sp.]|nr:hypothetical protein [Microlunatus sp.]
MLLPICVAIALIGVILAGLAWRRGNKGRVVQAAALVVVPFGLYLTGLLTVVWQFVVGLVDWAVHLIFSPLHWIGFGILALSVVLFVVGGLIGRFTGGAKEKAPKSVPGKASASVPGKAASTKAVAPRKQDADIDPELAEIEALLKSRGIE